MYVSPKVETSLPLFDYHKDKFGGTEYMVRNVLNKILPDLPKFKNYDCVVVPGLFDHQRQSSKERIIWVHNYPYEFSNEQLQILIDSAKEERTKFVIVVSETQKAVLVEKFGFPKEKMVVIPNAIYPLEYVPEKFNDVKTVEIVHAAAPERGMEILLSSLKYVEEDFLLRIFSNFYPESQMTEQGKYILEDKRVMFYGKTPQPTFFKYLEQSHIHSYPSIWSETFCLIQAEAMSAGCLNVYSAVENSAIAEISKGFAIDAQLGYKNLEDDAKKFGAELTKAIRQIKDGKWDPTAQIDYVNSTYTWEAAKANWEKLHDQL